MTMKGKTMNSTIKYTNTAQGKLNRCQFMRLLAEIAGKNAR